MCVDCETAFTFEMGHLLRAGVDPVSLRFYDAPCPNGHTVRVTPKDVRALL